MIRINKDGYVLLSKGIKYFELVTDPLSSSYISTSISDKFNAFPPTITSTTSLS